MRAPATRARRTAIRSLSSPSPSPSRPLGLMLTLVILSIGCAHDRMAAHEPFDPQQSSAAQRARVDALREPIARVLADAAAAGPEALLLLELDTLYAALEEEDRALLEEIRTLPGADPELGIPAGIDWIPVAGQVARTPAGDQAIATQLVTAPAWRAFTALDLAMRDDLGRGLLIGSAYRSPAYQLALIAQLLPRFDYVLEETLVHVSLPGASDHNRSDALGIDFVSERGVDLAWSDPAAFMALAEYRWLVAHAARFGFVPDAVEEGQPIASPWHWRFVGVAAGAP